MDNLLASLRKIAKEERAEADSPSVAPLSAADHDEIAAALLTAGRTVAPLRAVAASPKTAPAVLEPAGGASAAPLSASSSARPSWALAPRRWAIVALPLAAAAAFVFVWGRAPHGDAGGGALPAYDLTVEGGAKEVRGGAAVAKEEAPGANASVQRVVPGTELVLVARPADPVEGGVGVRVFVVDEAGVKEVDARTRISPAGSVEIRVAPWSALDQAQGAPTPAAAETQPQTNSRRSILRAVVGRAEQLRALSPKDGAGTPADAPGLRWLTVPLEVMGR